MYVCMYVCMYVWMDGWMAGWLAGWLAGCMHACMHACMDGWVDVLYIVYGWADVRRGGCIHMYVRTCTFIYVHAYMYTYVVYIIIIFVCRPMYCSIYTQRLLLYIGYKTDSTSLPYKEGSANRL